MSDAMITNTWIIYNHILNTIRDSEDSDTASTDEGSTWGGDGMFEYSQKGIPHSLQHGRELVETFGHHGAVCTCTTEAGHKSSIKEPAKRGRTYGDKNSTQNGMLLHVQKQELYVAVNQTNVRVLQQNGVVVASADDHDSVSDEGAAIANPLDPLLVAASVLNQLRDELHYADCWNEMVPLERGPPPMWGSTFLSKSVLIARNELLTLLRTKLEMQPTWVNISRLARKVRIRCFGSALLNTHDGNKRRVVGVSRLSPRRDFVRLKGTEGNTAMSAQVVCLIHVSGLRNARIPVPESLRVPANNTCCDDQVRLAVVRWLSPDPRCLLRDSKSLPLCPPPFGANHALWTFSKNPTRRSYFSDHMFARQLHLFPGSDRETKRQNAMTQKRAMYDLIQLESIDHFMNCTFIDGDHDSIMETVTLPFQ